MAAKEGVGHMLHVRTGVGWGTCFRYVQEWGGAHASGIYTKGGGEHQGA